MLIEQALKETDFFGAKRQNQKKAEKKINTQK